jgi:hypothetical protein
MNNYNIPILALSLFYWVGFSIKVAILFLLREADGVAKWLLFFIFEQKQKYGNNYKKGQDRRFAICP